MGGHASNRDSRAQSRRRGRTISAGDRPDLWTARGESFADVQTRVVACVHDLAERHAERILSSWSSHVGPIKALCVRLWMFP